MMTREEMQKYMRRALELAALERGRTSPNPMVGAVLVKNGRIIGEGRHLAAGTPHAETEAFKNAGADAAGSTLFVNLEPCSHQGKTPPCAPAVVAAGVSVVVPGMRDPNPLVSGRGIEILKAGGVEVVMGILEDECLRLNEVFVKYITTKIPFVTLKGAVTLDGKTASPIGDSKWITCEESRLLVHRLRGESDAVMVGAGTLLADNPSLTSRIPDKIKDPFRVVMDSSLRTPPDSNLCKLAADGKSIVITTEDAPEAAASALASAGCSVIRVASDEHGRPSLPLALAELGRRKITSLLVEGGGELNFSFLESGLADKVLLFIAPKLLGGRSGKTFVDGKGFERIADSIRIKDIEVKRLCDDILVEGYVDRERT